jgi:DnaJ-class molecular chaperone
MEKNILRIICPTCKGNGFIRKKQIIIQVWNFGISFVKIKQCKNCKSEGEVKVNDTQVAKISNASNGSKYYSCPHN